VATIVFNSATFRSLFPAYADAPTDEVLQLYWDTATAYITDKYGACLQASMKLAQQTLALNYMTAHLAYLNGLIAAGQTPGLMQSATVDKVSVSVTPPPVDNEWRWWLNLSPYGQQLLSLLEVLSVGGFYYGGFPTSIAFRR
jgi:hypothetical protein